MLTEIEIKNAKPKDGKPHKLKDAHGLHLLVTVNGSKLWRFRYRFEGKENMLGLGAHSPKSPEHVSLAKAREKCFVARGLLSEGRNPAAERKQPKASAANNAGVTFANAKKEWLASFRQTPMEPTSCHPIDLQLSVELQFVVELVVWSKPVGEYFLVQFTYQTVGECNEQVQST